MTRHTWCSVWATALVVSCAFALNGCAEPVMVHSHWGPGVRFSATTRTYAWAPGAERRTGEGRPKNEHLDGIVRQEIEKHFGLRGYEKAADGHPDFWIDYRVGRDVRADRYRDVDGVELVEGSLGVYLLNPEDSKLIWRGYAQARINESESPEVSIKRLDAAIGKLVAELPARTPVK